MDRLVAFWEAHGAFWAAALGAAFVRVWLSEELGWRAIIGTYIAAVFAAWVAAEPFMRWSGLDEDYLVPVVAFCALIGENIMRFIVRASNDQDFLKSIINRRFGGDK